MLRAGSSVPLLLTSSTSFTSSFTPHSTPCPARPPSSLPSRPAHSQVACAAFRTRAPQTQMLPWRLPARPVRRTSRTRIPANPDSSCAINSGLCAPPPETISSPDFRFRRDEPVKRIDNRKRRQNRCGANQVFRLGAPRFAMRQHLARTYFSPYCSRPAVFGGVAWKNICRAATI